MQERGIRVVSMVIDPKSPLGSQSNWCIPLKVFKGVKYEYLKCSAYSMVCWQITVTFSDSTISLHS